MVAREQSPENAVFDVGIALRRAGPRRNWSKGLSESRSTWTCQILEPRQGFSSSAKESPGSSSRDKQILLLPSVCVHGRSVAATSENVPLLASSSLMTEADIQTRRENRVTLNRSDDGMAGNVVVAERHLPA